MASVTTVTDLMQLDDLIRIDVGSEDKPHTFHVYADLLTTRSEFFKRALSKQWKEGEERVVKLPETDPQLFKLYMHYLYKEEFPIIPTDEHSGDEDYRSAIVRHTMAKLYVLAEQLQDSATKDAIVKAFIASIFTPRGNGRLYRLNAYTVCIIYNGTPAKSPLRRFLVDLYTEYAHGDWAESIATWHVDFVQEVATSLLAKRAATTGGSAHDARKDGGLAYMELKAEDCPEKM